MAKVRDQTCEGCLLFTRQTYFILAVILLWLLDSGLVLSGATEVWTAGSVSPAESFTVK